MRRERTESTKDYTLYRLNKQWRLFLDIKKREKGETVIVLYIRDPH